MPLSRSNPPSRPRRRWPWIFLGGFGLGGAALVGVALLPPVQGWIIRRLVAQRPGWRLDFERIGLGPTGLDASGLRFAMPGVTANSEPVVIRVAPTRLFSQRELLIERVEARKIRLVLTPAELAASAAEAGGAAPAPAAPFAGVLRLLHAPLSWALDAADLDGEIVVRDGGESRLTGAFSLRGGGLSAGTPGEFTYALSANSPIRPPGRDRQFTSAGSIRLTQTPEHGIARISINGDLRLPRYGWLALPVGKVALEVTASPVGENYSGHITLGPAARIAIEANLNAAHSTLAGRLFVAANQSAAQGLLGGPKLPQATGAGTLAFSLNLGTGDLDANLTGDFTARNWQALLPRLALLDAFTGRLAAAMTRRGERVTLENFAASFRGETSPAEAHLKLLGPIDARKPAGALQAEVALAHWPVEWANPFLTDSGVQVGAAEFSAGWTFSLDRDGAVRLEPTRAAELGPIALHGEKFPPVPPLRFSFRPRLEATRAQWTLAVEDFQASSPAGDRIEGSLTIAHEASGDETRSTGRLQGTLPALLAGATGLKPTAFAGDWDAAWAGPKAAARFALDFDLPAPPSSAQTFGPIHLGTRAKVHRMTPSIFSADEFSLQAGNRSGELLALGSPQPFLFGLSNAGGLVLSTLSPLQLNVGRLPLAWLRPWTGSLPFDGTLAPFQLSFSSRIDQLSLQSAEPLRVEGFSLIRAGREFIGDATVTFQPALALTCIALARPKFQIAYAGSMLLKNFTIETRGQTALGADLAVQFKGNDHRVLPEQIDFHSWIDFAAWKAGAGLGWPAQGRLATSVQGNPLGGNPFELHARLEGLPSAAAGQALPPLDLKLRGQISRENVLTGRVDALLSAAPRATDAEFDVRFDLIEGGLKLTSGWHSRFIDGAALLAWARASGVAPQMPASRPAPSPRPLQPGPIAGASLPFWGELSGSFDLDVEELQFAPYRIDRIHGRLDADRRTLALRDLTGEMFAGRWGGRLRIEHDPAVITGEHTLAGEFTIEQFESARVVQTVFPHQLAPVDARLDVRARVRSHGRSLGALIDQSSADFTAESENGILRLTVPRADFASTAAVFGGTVLFSPELRALGRLLKKFAEMPVDRLSVTGRRMENGEVVLDEFRLDSPQARLLGHGRIATDAGQPLMNRPLDLSLELAAKDELAVILGGMHLLEKKPRPDGYRAMRQPFLLDGPAGAPDTTPLYDLLAKGVSGSRGTWGFLMRRVQTEIEKKKTSR